MMFPHYWISVAFQRSSATVHSLKFQCGGVGAEDDTSQGLSSFVTCCALGGGLIIIGLAPEPVKRKCDAGHALRETAVTMGPEGKEVCPKCEAQVGCDTLD